MVKKDLDNPADEEVKEESKDDRLVRERITALTAPYRIATAHLRFITPYSQSRRLSDVRSSNESPEDFELRTWPDKCTTDSKGNVIINPMAMKDCLPAAAKRLKILVRGKKGMTWFDFLEAGIVVDENFPISLGINKKNVESITLWCDAKGRRGKAATSQVSRMFPIFPPGLRFQVRYIILDPIITQQIFEVHLREAGKFVGVGRARAEKGRNNGRFDVEKIVWSTG